MLLHDVEYIFSYIHRPFLTEHQYFNFSPTTRFTQATNQSITSDNNIPEEANGAYYSAQASIFMGIPNFNGTCAKTGQETKWSVIIMNIWEKLEIYARDFRCV